MGADSAGRDETGGMTPGTRSPQSGRHSAAPPRRAARTVRPR